MSDVVSLGGTPLKTFSVSYCVEQGYVIVVPATTPEEAERIVQQRLDDQCDVLDGSTRVHHGHFVNEVEEVRS